MRQDAGFTLIEMMVALALTSMIAMAGTALLSSTLKASGRLDDVSATTRNADLSHALMRDDFANIVDDPALFAGNRSGGDATLITLTRKGMSLGTDELVLPALMKVEYRYFQGNLVRRIWMDTGQTTGTPDYSDRVLASGMESLQLTYFDGNDWGQDWRADQEELPQAVAIRLEYGESDVLTAYYLVGGGG